MKRWAPRLALRKRLKVIRKWPVQLYMLHWMPYCLLLNNVYRIGDVFFRSGSCPEDLRSDFGIMGSKSLALLD